MSWLTGAAVFLVSLPLSVWFLASVLALVDEPDKTRPLVRLVLGVCVLLVVLMLSNRDFLYLFGAAFATVTILHTISFYGLRRAALRVPIYEEAPPPIPLVEDRDEPPEEAETSSA